MPGNAPFHGRRDRQGEFFILGGQIAYVAEAGETNTSPNMAERTARLRVIYRNGTESNLLRDRFSGRSTRTRPAAG